MRRPPAAGRSSSANAAASPSRDCSRACGAPARHRETWEHRPMANAADRAVVFVHGLWLHADSWTPWVERFGAAGYSPSAPGWPGHSASVQETRRNAEAVAGYGIGDVDDHNARIIESLGEKPVVIRHYYGGLAAPLPLAQDRRPDA